MPWERLAETLALVTWNVSWPAIIVQARLATIGDTYSEAAADLGCTPMQTVRRVMIPLLCPAIFASAILVFSTVIDDFVIVDLLSNNAANTPMSVYIYSQQHGGNGGPALNALGTIMLVMSFIVAILGYFGYRAMTRGERGRLRRNAHDDRGSLTRMTDLPGRARVVIVGGGVIGSSIAYHLTRLGWTDVLLLERDRLTPGTTWHAAGLITSAGMADETALWMSRYSRDLYARLEAETGLSTGFRAVGHISLATNPERLEALRREAAFARGFGVDDHEISPREVAEPCGRSPGPTTSWPASTSPTRAGPTRSTWRMSLAKGARQRGARIVEGVAVTGVRTRRAAASPASHRPRRHRDRVRRELRRACGPASSARWPASTSRCRRPSTTTCSPSRSTACTATCPSSRTRTATATTARRAAACWSACSSRSPRRGRSTASPRLRLRRAAAGLGPGRAVPRAGDGPGPGRSPTSGPEVLLRAGVLHARHPPDARPGAGADGYWVAAGLNSLGILLGGGVGRSSRSGWSTASRRSTSRAYAVERALPYETSRRFRAERTVEQLGVLFGDAAWPTLAAVDGARRPPLAAARPAGRGRRALRRLGGLGVPRVVRRTRRRQPAAPAPDFGRQAASTSWRGRAPRRAARPSASWT